MSGRLVIRLATICLYSTYSYLVVPSVTLGKLQKELEDLRPNFFFMRLSALLC